MSTSVLELKNAFFEVLKYQKLSPDQEDLFRPIIEAQHVDFNKNVNFILFFPVIDVLGSFDMRNAVMIMKTCQDRPFGVYKSISPELSILYPYLVMTY